MEDPTPVQAEICSTSVEGSQTAGTHAVVENLCNKHGSGPSAGGSSPHRSIIDVPPELLIIIFQSFLPIVNPTSLGREGTCTLYMKGLYSLRLVSRRWRNLLDNVPSFWVVLTSTVPHIVNQTSITRSGDAPLILHSRNLVRGMRGDASLERFIKLVGPTRERWKVLWVDWPCTGTIWEYLASPAPMLETLHLPTNYDPPASLELLGNETHNIRHLDLICTRIRWARSMFRGLKYLGLCGCGGEGLTTDVILDILANSPDLEDLKIRSMIILESDTPFNPIVLPHLLSIDFQGLGGDLVYHLLRHIEVPHCQRINIQTTSGSEPDQLLERSIVLFESLFRDLHKESGGSQLLAGSGLLQWYAGGFNPSNGEYTSSFVVRTSLPSFAPMLRWIERVFDWAEFEGLEATIHISGQTDLQDPEITSVLRRLRSVTTLCASRARSIHNSRETVALLGYSDNDDIRIFPSLKILRVFCNDVTPEEILEMVQNRFTTHPNQGGPRKPSDLEIIAETIPVTGPRMPVGSLSFAVIAQIRAVAGVKFKLVRRRASIWRSGMLAIVWDDERGVPAWG